MAKIVNDVSSNQFEIHIDVGDDLEDFGKQIAEMATGGSIEDINKALDEFYQEYPEEGEQIVFGYMKELEKLHASIVNNMMDDGFDDTPRPVVPADKAFGI